MSYQWSGITFSSRGDPDGAAAWPPDWLIQLFYPQIEQLLMSVTPLWQAFPSAQVISWYRDPDHNAAAGGQPLSSHLLGLGLDVKIQGGQKTDYDDMGSWIDGYMNDGTTGQYGPNQQPDRNYLVWTDEYEGLHLHVQVYYGRTPESFGAFNLVYDAGQSWYTDWVASFVSSERDLAALNYEPDAALT